VNIAVAFALALLVDVSQGAVRSAGGWTGDEEWTVTRWSRTGATYILSVWEASRDWSPGEATGPPDAPNGGDSVRAWASASADGQEEWLLLEYEHAVVPVAVRVYETCSTGALSKISFITDGGEEVAAWSGTDPTPTGARVGMSVVPLRVSLPVKRLKLYFDSARVAGWNEVDAVALVGAGGRQSWARSARASSTYAARYGAGAGAADGGPAALAPPWTGMDSSKPRRSAGIKTVHRAVEARGWPMLALWADVSRNPTPTSPAPAPTTLTHTTLGAGTPALMTTGFLVTGGSGAAAPGGAMAPVQGQAALPLRPIWGAFLANSAFYAVVLFGLFWALVVPRRFVRELSRLRRGCCVACGYDLGFDFVPGCPECGWRRPATATHPQPAQ